MVRPGDGRPLTAKEDADLDQALHGTLALDRPVRRLSRLIEFLDPTDPTKLYYLTPENLGICLYPDTPKEVWQKEFARWVEFNHAVCGTKELGVIWRNQGDCVLVRIRGNLPIQGGGNEGEIWGSFLCRGFLPLLKSRGQNEGNGSRITTRKMSDLQRWCVT